MLLTRQADIKSYPEEAVAECWKNRNGISRRANRTLLKEGTMAEPTLLELEQPELYRFYDIFEVQDFSYSASEGKGHLRIQISLIKEYRNLKISAQILDLESQKVLGEITPETAENTSVLVVEEDFELTERNNVQSLGIIAYGDWGNNTPEDNELSVFRKANSADADYVYRHIWPKKEKCTVTLGTLEGRYPEPWVSGSTDHIVIALIRRPGDMKDVDYLCGFGRDKESGHPRLCVPGQGDLIFSEEEFPKEDEDHRNSAVCKLYRKSGGAAIIAGTPDYYCEQTIGITPLGHSYHYEFVSWYMGYDDPAGWKKTEFDYQMDMEVYTVTKEGGEEKWHVHELKVTSIKGEASFTQEVLPLQIMYGCMSGNTKICMADGCAKEIRSIRIGDQVLGRGGRLMRVVNVWEGPEMEQMVEVHAEGLPAEGLLLTKQHPVWVMKSDGSYGWKRAGECTAEDKLLVGNPMSGEAVFTPVAAIIRKVPDDNMVYNLDLEPKDAADGEGTMFGNGVLIGDNRIQNGIWR